MERHSAGQRLVKILGQIFCHLATHSATTSTVFIVDVAPFQTKFDMDRICFEGYFAEIYAPLIFIEKK